ncbi:hypothetical protein [Pseudoduganella lurida]|uniref:hypothetical protein n=1 Tax=Pseudoduganella lurida TaxID=1036180 RepID=UPI0011AAA5F0|nr:hypothetical protein [Pseudoduganella lurida]
MSHPWPAAYYETYSRRRDHVGAAIVQAAIRLLRTTHPAQLKQLMLAHGIPYMVIHRILQDDPAQRRNGESRLHLPSHSVATI